MIVLPLVSYGINMLDRKAVGNNIGIKLDTSKAFHIVNWDFLFAQLRKFSFHEKFIHWISMILSLARLSILINGSTHGFFKCGSGVR